MCERLFICCSRHERTSLSAAFSDAYAQPFCTSPSPTFVYSFVCAAGYVSRSMVTVAEKSCAIVSWLDGHVRPGAKGLHEHSTHAHLLQTRRYTSPHNLPIRDTAAGGYHRSRYMGPSGSQWPVGSPLMAKDHCGAFVNHQQAPMYASNGRHMICVSACIGVQAQMKHVAETSVAHTHFNKVTMAAQIPTVGPGSLTEKPHKSLHTSSILADSVKRKRATKMKRHKWKKRMRLLRRRTKTSRGGKA